VRNNQTFSSIRRAILAVAAGSAVVPVRASETVKIGLTGPYTGGSSPMGESMRNGVRLAVDDLNFIGGILGRRIELVERDDKADPETGRKIAEEMVQREKVAATIGIVNTGVGLVSIDAYQKARIPLMIAVSTGTALTRKFAPPAAPENYIFRVSPTLDLEAEVLGRDLVRRGLKRVALLADATPYGEAGVGAVKNATSKNNLELVAIERFKIGDTNMNDQLKNCRAAGAQALLLWGIGPEMAAIARGRSAMKWNVPILGGWTLSMANYIDPSGSAGEGSLVTQTFIQEAGGPERNSFLLSYERTFKQSRIPSPMSAAQGYDAAIILANAITQAGSFDGPKIREALENLQRPVRGVITIYNRPFTPQDHDAITANMIVIGKVSGGRVTYAYEEDAKRFLMQRRKQS
jgi:branched-chain amino acid transport system substrate-binding protein